jgi:hypothetical protein
MNRPFHGPLGAVFVSAALALAGATVPVGARADQEPPWLDVNGPGVWRLVVSPYSLHFRPSEEHEYVWGIGAERQHDNGWLWGAVYFSNSFGQDSGYLYLGQRYPGIFSTPPLYFQWTAGILYGYKGKYEDKVPLNAGGFSPGAVVSLGWRFDHQTSVQANLLGDAALMLQLSFDFR